MTTPLLESTRGILEQIRTQVARLTDEQYARPLALLSESSPGMHIRHILEFYECLINQAPQGVICYDKRKRDKTLETSIQEALRRTTQIEESVKKQKSLLLQLEVCTPDGSHTQRIPTNWERELSYNLEHAIHHLAILKVGMKYHLPEVELVKDLGVAPATFRFRESLKS
ncbi:MAG: hypothetical protein AAF740_10600 [Bacteroidota bacterium]